MKRVLLTGAGGFVGRHLRQLLEHECELFSVRRLPTGADREVVADLSSFDPSAFPAVDVVVHTAALMDASDLGLLEAVNVRATERLVEWSVASGVSRFLFVSSGAVYGPSPTALPEDAPRAGVTPYALSKIAGENAVLRFRDRLLVQIARLYFPYGPGQEGRFLPNLLLKVMRGDAVRLASPNGEPRLSLTFVSDVAAALDALLRGCCEGAVNVAGPEGMTMLEIAETVGRGVGRAPLLKIEEGPEGQNFLADTRRLRETIGFEPKITFAEGLRLVLSTGSRASDR